MRFFINMIKVLLFLGVGTALFLFHMKNFKYGFHKLQKLQL